MNYKLHLFIHFAHLCMPCFSFLGPQTVIPTMLPSWSCADTCLCHADQFGIAEFQPGMGEGSGFGVGGEAAVEMPVYEKDHWHISEENYSIVQKGLFLFVILAVVAGFVWINGRRKDGRSGDV